MSRNISHVLRSCRRIYIEGFIFTILFRVNTFVYIDVRIYIHVLLDLTLIIVRENEFSLISLCTLHGSIIYFGQRNLYWGFTCVYGFSINISFQLLLKS